MAQWFPIRGDVVWLVEGGEAKPTDWLALTVSLGEYNRASGTALFCPIITTPRGYPFEVPIPPGLEVEGAVVSDQVRAMDWAAMRAKFVCRMPEEVTYEVIGKLISVLTG